MTRGTERGSQGGGYALVLQFIVPFQPGKPGSHILEAALGVLSFDSFNFILKLQQFFHSLRPSCRGPLFNYFT